MKKQIIQLYSKYKNFVLYGIIGAISAGIDFAIYTLLFRMGLDFSISNIISVHCGIFCSFLLNRQYNFKVKDKMLSRFLSFYAIGLTGLALSAGLLWLMVTNASWNEIYAKLLTIVAVAILQFFLNKFLTFRKRTN
jgi:putative flippase GtrA